MTSSFNKVTHCIFDMDGLLLDTEAVICEIHSSIAAQYNKTYPLETRMKAMGMVDKVSAKIIIEDLGLPITVDEFVTQRRRELIKLLPRVHLMPGAEKLVQHLHDKGIPTAVATSSGMDSVNLKTSNHKQFVSLFHHIVAAGTDPEVKQGKPHPDVYIVCAARFDDNPSPSLCLAFEDAPNGVCAARAAGMQVVMVPDPRISDDLKKEATLVISSLEEFKPELFGLPEF